MAQLAIQGHPTRGKEVIEILEMLGGKNVVNHSGSYTKCYYFVDNNIICNIYGRTNLQYYTLEEFEDKFPYKVGDKVIDIKTDRIAEIYKAHWSESNNCTYYDLKYLNNSGFVRNYKFLRPYKEENMEEKKINQISLANCNLDEVEIVLGDKFELKTKDGKYYIVRKKLEYPKTFIEVLNFWHPDRQLEDDYQRDYKKDLIENFQDLLYARDTYWEIAGEEMGLGKPWEPDWKKQNDKYIIDTFNDTINYLNNSLHRSIKSLKFS